MEDVIKLIGLEEVRTKLREIAAENPQKITERFTSPVCRYVHPKTGECSCIIGVLLDRLGFDREAIKGLDVAVTSTSVGSLDGQEVWKRFTADALMYMGRAQMFQDGVDTWESAVRRAEKLTEEGS